MTSLTLGTRTLLDRACHDKIIISNGLNLIYSVLPFNNFINLNLKIKDKKRDYLKA